VLGGGRWINTLFVGCDFLSDELSQNGFDATASTLLTISVVALAEYWLRSVVIEIPKRIDKVLKRQEHFRQLLAVCLWI
jgi:hypothetical protein